MAFGFSLPSKAQGQGTASFFMCLMPAKQALLRWKQGLLRWHQAQERQEATH